MRKKEMSEEQLADRETVVKRLKKAGWSGTAFNELFDAGDFIYDEASMEYDNRSMLLTVNYTASNATLTLRLEVKSGKQVVLVIEFGDKLKELLELIVSFQKKVSPTNYKDYGRKVLKLCPNTFADLGDKGLARLTDDESNSN